MTDWQMHAANGQWNNIPFDDMSDEERSELLETLIAIVPIRIRGDGLEVFEDIIEPHEALDKETAEAASFLRFILDHNAFYGRKRENLFMSAVELAKHTLETELGIRYHGMGDTYLYQRPDGSLKQVRRSFGQAICHHVSTLGGFFSVPGEQFEITAETSEQEKNFIMDLMQDQFDWIDRYPWRNTKTLDSYRSSNYFKPNSAVDHAVAISHAEKTYQGSLQYAERPPADPKARKEADLQLLIDPWFVAELGFTIGYHFAALQKKPIEKDAIKKRKEVADANVNGQKGGLAHSMKAAERISVLNRRAKEDGGFALKSDKFEVSSPPHSGAGRARVFFMQDKDAVARAMDLAEAYDKDSDQRERLFWHRGEPLQTEWFVKWWEKFKIEQK